jgi:hypothetical protein
MTVPSRSEAVIVLSKREANGGELFFVIHLVTYENKRSLARTWRRRRFVTAEKKLCEEKEIGQRRKESAYTFERASKS